MADKGTTDGTGVDAGPGGEFGVVGLGVMGANLALNLADRGVAVAAHDPWPQARAAFADRLVEAAVSGVTLADDPAALVAALAPPRAILVMVKAGDPVDAVIADLAPRLAPGDTLIDGGNSHFRDTLRREAGLAARGLHFVGLGVSGGEAGARRGPALMAGCAPQAWERVRPVLDAIAARADDGTPCCARLGPDGAGHFVKMVHNGIEYAIMQVIAEAHGLLRDLCGLDHGAMAGVFRSWNRGDLDSYLIDLTARVLDRTDPLTGEPLVAMILDTAGQKGTGRWSSEAALELGVPTPTITEAVFARFLAGLKAERVAASAILRGPGPAPDLVGALCGGDDAVESIRQAVLGATVAAYAQGLALIAGGSRAHGWDVDLAAVAAVWRAGCVIRSALLKAIARAFASAGGPGAAPPANLMADPEFADLLAGCQGGWRRTVCRAVAAGVPVPGLSSALAYLDGYRSDRLWANLIQAQRDAFGAHTYERTDRPGTFHTEW
ncbi:MAG: NADP-dependent phosphogluconate dehydrogenase [Rhodobacterales bacterium]|nr:NADP-dependent phosphogluconate dehydrogenase [Rhodobacterales bacterium]